MKYKHSQSFFGLFFAVLVAALLCSSIPMAHCYLGVSVPRESISIRHVENDRTLVAEKRLLRLEEGLNSIVVNHVGVEMTPSSLRIDFLGGDRAPVLLRVSSKSGNPQLATWLIHAASKGNYEVVITYLTDELPINTTYIGYITTSSMVLKGNTSIQNNSRQNLVGASVLVSEKLASHSITLKPGEKKELVATHDATLPATELYVFDSELYGQDVMLLYELENTCGSMLPAGTIQIFKREEDANLVFIGEDNVPWVNCGQAVPIIVGNVQDILVERELVSFERTNFRRDEKGHIQVYDTSEEYTTTLTNRREGPATILVREHVPDEWDMVRSDPPEYTRESAYSFSFRLTLEPEEKRTISYHIRRQNLLPQQVVRALTE